MGTVSEIFSAEDETAIDNLILKTCNNCKKVIPFRVCGEELGDVSGDVLGDRFGDRLGEEGGDSKRMAGTLG